MSIIEAITRALPYEDMIDAQIRNGSTFAAAVDHMDALTSIDNMITETLVDAAVDAMEVH